VSRIVAYKAENFKGLRDVAFAPDPWVVLVVGPNGAGKSSVLDAIMATLAGARAAPPAPVREGAGGASCSLDLGTLRVTRRWTPGGPSRLYVENADGSRPRSPQACLDALVGAVAFDPLAFTRLEPREQARTLRKLAGLEDEFARIDAEIDRIKGERAEVNRAVRADEGALANLPPESELAGVPDEEPSPLGLMEWYQGLLGEQAENDALRARLVRELGDLAQARSGLRNAAQRVRQLRDSLAEAEAEMESWQTRVAGAEEAVAESQEVVASLRDPDLDSAKRRMERAEAVAAKSRQKRERAEVAARWAANRETAADLTSRVTSLEAEKTERLVRAELPVCGCERLDFTGDEVLAGGVPLRQLNTAGQIRLGLAVGAALNPGLRVALVRDGSLLDEQTLDAVCVWARENDFQVWLERVGNRDAPAGLVIEEGRLVADRQPRPAVPQDRWPEVKCCDCGRADCRHCNYAQTAREAEELF
jgi:hypothetical protein